MFPVDERWNRLVVPRSEQWCRRKGLAPPLSLDQLKVQQAIELVYEKIPQNVQERNDPKLAAKNKRAMINTVATGWRNQYCKGEIENAP